MAAEPLGFSLNDPVKLVNVPKKMDVVVFQDGLKGRAAFSPEYKHIQSVMELIGLDVLLNGNNDSNAKRRVRLADDDFGISFYKFYYQRSMNPDDFKWELIR
jgi:hypothetical protein